jgi:hypothetical protein
VRAPRPRPRARSAAPSSLDAGGDPDERGDRGVRASLPEERALELGIGPVERLVDPIEAPARLGDPEQQVDENGAEERVVLRGITARVRAGVDPRGRLARELLEGDQRVVAAA